MELNVLDLISKSNFKKEIDITLKDEKGFYYSNEEIEYLNPPRLSGVISASGDILILEGQLEAEIKLTCSRCLDKFSYSINKKVCEEFIKNPEGEDDEKLSLRNNAIDITEVIENNIIIELPIKRICREDCKGLCQQCGENLNHSKCKCEKEIDPRLAKLKDLFSDN